MSGGALRAQYEAHPYPRRDPRDEARRLVVGSPSHVDEIVHYGFAGADPTARGRRFRALVAGGGTGDATVMMGQQLSDRGADAEVLHVDLSRASLKIAQARVRARRLRNVRFLRASLFDLAARAPFDYIDCCGVLHHLEDPAEGLRRLAALLADDGAMGVMVYGAFGRTGVYQAQAALRLLGAPAESDGGLALARAFPPRPARRQLAGPQPVGGRPSSRRRAAFTTCSCTSGTARGRFRKSSTWAHAAGLAISRLRRSGALRPGVVARRRPGRARSGAALAGALRARRIDGGQHEAPCLLRGEGGGGASGGASAVGANRPRDARRRRRGAGARDRRERRADGGDRGDIVPPAGSDLWPPPSCRASTDGARWPTSAPRWTWTARGRNSRPPSAIFTQIERPQPAASGATAPHRKRPAVLSPDRRTLRGRRRVTIDGRRAAFFFRDASPRRRLNSLTITMYT